MDMVLGYLKREMFPAALIAATLFLCMLPFRKKRLRAKGRVSPPLREGALLLFGMLLAGLLSMTLTPYGFWTSILTGNPPILPPPFSGGVNLIPLRSLDSLVIWVKHGRWSFILVNYLGNVVMFLPMGFFPALLWSRPTWLRSLLSGFGCSLFIECFQLLVARGTDVDDLLLNTLGALCGFWLFLLMRRVAPGFTAQFTCQQQEAPEWMQ